MVKPSDISKLMGGVNYWTWKPEAEALLLADGSWSAVDPSVPVPGGVVQMRNWTNDNQKAYGILYLTLSPAVQAKVNNAGVGRSGRLLWAQLASFYTTSDPANRSILMSQFNNLSHDISKPADEFLQAVVTAESRLTAIAVSLPPFMVQDKILAGLSSVYSPITTVLQNESPQRAIPDMVAAINTWELADLQKRDSVIKAVRFGLPTGPNHGGEIPEGVEAYAARGHHHRSDRSSHSAAGKEFDWTNTKNRTDVCHRCGLPGHFAQYCVSIMPDDVRRRILRDRDSRAHLTENSGGADEETGEHAHFAAAVLDLPDELNLDTMDPTVREGFLSTVNVIHHADSNGPFPTVDSSNYAYHFDLHPQPSPPSPTLTALSAPGTPSKKKRKKKKSKKPATVEDVQLGFQEMSFKEEDEFSM
ncbi:hypothetical protein FB451DRAFT_1221047 [Mycena latifolia]|nr:hypothetical protein FB451DRAFT_1221047 [Mycena latifolia]